MLAELIRNGRKMPKVLYHYTSPEAFVDIVGHKNGVRLMCTNYRFLNDDAEFVDGYEMALDWMRKKGLANDVFERVRRTNEKTEQLEDWLATPWILSFSEDGDSTAHWMTYADRGRGGFAIGVDSKILADCVCRADAKIKDVCRAATLDNECCFQEPIGGMFVAPCIYYRREKDSGQCAFINALEYIFSENEAFCCLRKRNQDLYAVHCLRRVLQVAALLKRDDYEFENEWRVVFVPMRQIADMFSGIKIVGGKPRLSLRRTLDGRGSREIVRQVVVAPHGSVAKNTMIANLERLTVGGAFKVIPSSSSYNGR